MSSRAPSKRPLDLITAGTLSVAGHALVAFTLLGLVQLARSGEHEAARNPTVVVPPEVDTEVEIELPRMANTVPVNSPTPHAEVAPAPPTGGAHIAHPDENRAGKGGDATARELALNFANQDDGITRDPSLLSTLRNGQLPRIEAGAVRRSYEDTRMSREPMSLTFVAMGSAPTLAERRREARIDPARGMLRANSASTLGAREFGAAPAEGDRSSRSGGAQVGGPALTVGAGYQRGPREGAESAALRNALARPMVTPGAPSIPANEVARPSDTIDTEQAVLSRLQALMHASTRGGLAGIGRGGEAAAGAPGAGGQSGQGSLASPVGRGGQGPGDVERMNYLRSASAKIYPLTAHAFPKQAIAEGLSGSVIVTIVIEEDGRISSSKITRASGIEEFDENIRKALIKASPFGPLPAALKPRLVWAFSFAATNPAVRPKDPANGLSER